MRKDDTISLSRRILIRNVAATSLILPFGMAARAQAPTTPAPAAGRGGGGGRAGQWPRSHQGAADGRRSRLSTTTSSPRCSISSARTSPGISSPSPPPSNFSIRRWRRPTTSSCSMIAPAVRRARRRKDPVTEPGARGPRNVDFRQPSAALKRGIKAMLQRGKGMVLFHHALASWVHTWPEYVEMMGGACDWSNPITLRGQRYPFSGFRGGVTQRISVVEAAKGHPVVRGLENGFTITDETYLCPMFPETFPSAAHHRLCGRSAELPGAEADQSEWNPARVPNYAGWYKAVENSPLVYLQNGHDNTAWTNPAFPDPDAQRHQMDGVAGRPRLGPQEPEGYLLQRLT